MNKAKFLILLTPALLFSCNVSGSSSPIVNEIEKSVFRYTDPEEVAINVTKEGVEIVSIDVINIPDLGIMVADWDNANIKLHVSYNDSTTEDFPLLVKHIPIDSRHYLGEIGHHNIEIMVNGHSTKFGFNIINNPDFHGYKCEFFDAYAGGKVYEATVGYYQNVTYDGPSFVDHEVGDEFYRSFVHWDYPLTNVHQDMTYNSVYRDTEKRFYGDNVLEGQNQVVSTYKDEDDGSIHALVYLGRIHRVALNYGQTIYHTQGDEAKELSLQDISLFNERWEQLNNDTVKYGLKYNFDSSTGQNLFGSNSALGSAPNCLSNFESIYDNTSITVTLDTEDVVNTSSAANYQTIYSLVSAHKADTVNVTSDLETGYYRAAIVANFDAYVSVSFSKLANNKYELGRSSKYVFAPIASSLDILAQYSETEEFINNYDKKVEFSNKLLLDIAKGLDWED